MTLYFLESVKTFANVILYICYNSRKPSWVVDTKWISTLLTPHLSMNELSCLSFESSRVCDTVSDLLTTIDSLEGAHHFVFMTEPFHEEGYWENDPPSRDI